MIPQTQITGQVFDQLGQPSAGTEIVIELEALATDPDHGKVRPSRQTITPDHSGRVTFSTWPNQRAMAPVRYRVHMQEAGKVFARGWLDVPDQQTPAARVECLVLD